jgi:hypothetical protein
MPSSIGQVEESAKNAYFEGRGAGKDPRAGWKPANPPESRWPDELAACAPKKNRQYLPPATVLYAPEQNVVEQGSVGFDLPHTKVANRGSAGLVWSAFVANHQVPFLELNGGRRRIQVAADSNRLQSEWQETNEKRIR